MSRTNRPILSIEKLPAKEAYWDVQVDGTENYVTVDGAIHHNSTKTTASVMKIAYHAKRMRPGRDGIRRSRCAWIRNTREQLRDTSIPSFLTWFPDGQAGLYEKTAMRFVLKFDDVECEVLFRGLDDSNDVKRLLSLELSFAVLDETREINPDIYNALTARLGRYPSKIDGGCVDDDGKRNDHLWGATNPPDMDTFWEELFTEPPNNVHVSFQPSGLSEEADWIEFLPEGYYENIAEGKTQDWIDVYIHAKFGKSLAGKPVFRSFNRALHVAEKPLLFNALSAGGLVVGMDTALHPAAVIGQIGFQGRLNVLHSLHAADTGALRFIREHLKPVLATRFGGARVTVIIDPAGMQRSQTDESTVADILRAEGFVCRAASTNAIAARIAAVDSYLTRTVDGKPAFLIDPEYNRELIQALAGKYRFRIKTTGEAEEKPDKLRPFADLCFSAGTLVMTPHGEVAIASIRAGDTVLTPHGERTVVASAQTGVSRAVEYELSNGRKLVATPGHPVFVEGKGFVPIDEVGYSDVLYGIYCTEEEKCGTELNVPVSGAEENSKRYQAESRKERESIAAKCAIRPMRDRLGLSSTGYGSGSTLGMGTIGGETGSVGYRSIGTCGRYITGLFRRVMTYTTKIITGRTTIFPISRLSPCTNTGATIPREDWPTATKGSLGGLSWPERKQKSGTPPTKEESGIQNTGKTCGRTDPQRKEIVCTAESNMLPSRAVQNEGFAQNHAKGWPGKNPELTTNNVPVLSAAGCLCVTNTPKRKRAVRIVGKKRLAWAIPVYDIQVEDAGVFYAEGVLVHNCDALEYLCLHADGGATFGRLMNVSRRREIKHVESVGWT